MATCTTSSDFVSSVREPTMARLVSFSASPRSVPVTRRAGAMPNRMPVASATAEANNSTRQSSGACPAAPGQQLASPVRDQQPEGAADEREQHAFGQQLAHQPHPRGADRETHGNLLLPRRGTRQQQVGDVGADEQQDQPDDALMIVTPRSVA